MWTLELADEIVSDLSVFHRIDDPMQIDAARYFRLSEFLPAYDGAVRRRFERILRDAEKTPDTGEPAPVSSTAGAEVLATRSTAGNRQFPGFEYKK